MRNNQLKSKQKFTRGIAIAKEIPPDVAMSVRIFKLTEDKQPS